MEFFGDALEVSPSTVTLVAGPSARRKTVRVVGIGAEGTAKWLGVARD